MNGSDAQWQPLPVDGPLDFDLLLGYFARRAIPGVEAVDAATSTYRRTVVVDGKTAILEVRPLGATGLQVRLDRLRPGKDPSSPVPEAVDGVRRIFGADRDPRPATEHLRADPVLAPLVTARPGLRVPGTWDPYETGVRAIVGQQVSVAGANTVIGRIVARAGTPLDRQSGRLTHTFPRPDVLARADLSAVGMPGSRVAAIQAFAAAVADGSVPLDGEGDLEDVIGAICQIRGLGPWTAHYLALRMGLADAFPASDLGLRRAVEAGTVVSERELAARSERWRPHRALAALYLWLSEGAP